MLMQTIMKKSITPKSKYRKKEFEIKLLKPTAIKPQKSHDGSIGFDLTTCEDIVVPAHSRVAIPLGFAINLPFGTEAKIEPRSGCSLRGMEGYGTKTIRVKCFFGLFHRNKTKSGRMFYDADVMVGKIDPNYTDEINVLLVNHDEEFVLRAGSRIAQMTFYHTISPFFKEVEALSCKSRGGGLGHSGTDRLRPRIKGGHAATGNPQRLLVRSSESLTDDERRLLAKLALMAQEEDEPETDAEEEMEEEAEEAASDNDDTESPFGDDDTAFFDESSDEDEDDDDDLGVHV